MDVEEFKKLKPEYKNVEGNELWDAMENYMLRLQTGEQIIRTALPIWKTHTLRWLFYRKKPNFKLGNPKIDKWTSDKVCKECKRGVNTRFGFMVINDDGTSSYKSYCPHCHKEYTGEPNKNISYKIYKIANAISIGFWTVLDKLHLVRNSHFGRYDMFGDESMFVSSYKMFFDTGKTEYTFKHRRWWEYIIIPKR